jgi:hypothetical protein
LSEDGAERDKLNRLELVNRPEVVKRRVLDNTEEAEKNRID